LSSTHLHNSRYDALYESSLQSALTSTSAGPVAYGGMLAMSGVKKRLMKKPNATTSAVMPVRPPSRMPAGVNHFLMDGLPAGKQSA
jgi:hypothetical protein